MSMNRGINETQRVPQAVTTAPSNEILDGIRINHRETSEMLSHINHTLSMYKLQISDLKSQLDDFKSNSMLKLQNIVESNTAIKSDIENIKSDLNNLIDTIKNTKKNYFVPHDPQPSELQLLPHDPQPSELQPASLQDNQTIDLLILDNHTNQHANDNSLLTQLASEPQKVTVSLPKATRGRRPRKNV